ncbi:MAG: ATP-binding protein [Firmicutes bacterium]|nr:ATP-binding protein [Bacillota bacterium]
MKKIQEKSLNKAVIWRVALLVSAALLTLIIAVVIAVPQFNRQAAINNAKGYLQIFKQNISQNNLSTDAEFNHLVTLTDINYLRVTIIDLSGTVIADTQSTNSEPFSHADRPEIIAAIMGEIGENIRKSESTGIDYLYFAQRVYTGGRDVVLRVAVPVNNFNIYIWPLVGIMALIFVLVLVGVVLVTPKMTKSITAPISMIKHKLDNIGKAKQTPIVLTKHDEINRVLLEIDEISDKLNFALTSYQSEKHKLDLILENIDQAIVAIDIGKKIIACNKTAEDYFNFEFTQPVSINTALKNRTLLDNINQAIDNNQFMTYDFVRLNGQIYQVRLIPVKLNEISLIISAQNVTDIRKTSQEKQEFFANAGHELNTPLSSIIGYSELILKEKKYNQPFVETINRESLRMKLLIEGMLKISELEENKEILDEKIDLKSIVEQVINAAKPKAENKKIKLSASLENAAIFANAEKITEVVSNLIDNAIKYTDTDSKVGSAAKHTDTGEADFASFKVKSNKIGNTTSHSDTNTTVFVSLKVENNNAVLTVKDNGIGINQKDLNRIFERFYQVDKARSKTEGGSGLGLAIVKHICNHYNAPIKIQSTEGLGTEIKVIFNLI